MQYSSQHKQADVDALGHHQANSEEAILPQNQDRLLDLARDMIIVHDMEGEVLFWNRGAESKYGWSRHDAVGANVYGLLKTRFPVLLAQIHSILFAEGGWEGELVQERKDGKKLTVLSRWACQRNEKGEPVAILQIDTDITRRRNAEKESDEAKLLANSVFQTMNEGLVVIDARLKIVMANKAFCRLFGVRVEEVLGKEMRQVGQQQLDIKELGNLLADVIPLKSDFTDLEVTCAMPNLGRRTLLLSGRRLLLDGDAVRRILVVLSDITVHRKQQQAIVRSRERLRELTERLMMTEENERRRIGTAVHDSVGQALAFVKREIAGLAKKCPESMQNSFGDIQQRVNEAIRETRNLTFELSNPTLRMFGIDAAVEEILEYYARREKWRFTFESDEKAKPLSEHLKILVYRSVRELITNIAKHAAASEVKVRSFRRGKELELTVEDDGRGFEMDPSQAVSPRPGGLGLPSIRERLVYFSGELKVDSEPGRGTRVTIKVPF